MACHLTRSILRSSCGLRYYCVKLPQVRDMFPGKQLKATSLLCANSIMCLRACAHHSLPLHFIVEERSPKLTVFHLSQSPCSFTKQFSLLICASHFRRTASSKTPAPGEIRFQGSDKCLVFDNKNTLQVQTTFNEAKSLAARKNSRLVFLHRNPDGLLCFKLHNLDSSSVPPRQLLGKEDSAKTKRSSMKEFKIKSAINDHDLNIKLERIKSILVKDKPVVVVIATVQSNAPKEVKSATYFIKKFSTELKDFCKVHQEYSNENATRLSLTPVENKDSESMSSESS